MSIRIVKFIFILCIGLCLFSCTAVTKFDVYEISPSDNKRVALSTGNVEVTLYLNATEKRKLYIPFIYQKSTIKEPYRMAITIDGLITDIEIIETKVRINSEFKRDYIVVNREDFEYSPLSDGAPYFYLKSDKYLNYPWKDIEEVEIIFDFYGIKDGVKTRYQARKIFKPHFESFLTNDAMSV